MELTAEVLRDLVHYDAETGAFTWRVSRGKAARGKVAGRRTQRGYIQIGIEGRGYYAHRLAWLYIQGQWPPNQVDHINMCKSDNRIVNLRLATASQNKANTCIPRNNTSGAKGTWWNKARRRWQVQIQVNGRNKAIGRFMTYAEAERAYSEAAAKYFGEYANSEKKTGASAPV